LPEGGATISHAVPANSASAPRRKGSDTLPSQHVVRERQASARDVGARQAAREVPREDTVALLERASAPRELSTRTSIAVILLWMLIAGVATYFWRAAQASDAASPVPDGKPASRP
jgi:methylase of polypeptide subunit release factors